MPKKKTTPADEVLGGKELDLQEEQISVDEQDASARLPKEASVQDIENMEESAVISESIMEGAGTDDDILPAEVAAINADNDIATELDEAVASDSEVETPKKSTKKVAPRKKARSDRYLKARHDVDKNTIYTLTDAIALVKKTSTTKFDGTIEAHFALDIKKQKGKTTESIRGTVSLPGGAIRVPKVVILDEEMIEKILKTGKIDFDLALSTPAMMPKIGKLAKILGPQGKMPNPKVGTVTEDPAKTKAEIESGRVEYRADSFNIVHVGIGKVSWADEKIQANMKAILDILGRFKIKSITLASSMGPGIKTKV